MRFFTALATAFLFFASPASAAENVKCLSCKPVTVELPTAQAMLDFVMYADHSDAERKRVLEVLMGWVYENKEYELGLTLAGRMRAGYGQQEISIETMLGKGSSERLRGFLATAESPSQLVQALRSFVGESAYTANERELMCAKILNGTDIEAVRGFDAGCRFGRYADSLRARVLNTTDGDTARAVLNSDFGRAFLTFGEKMPLFKFVHK